MKMQYIIIALIALVFIWKIDKLQGELKLEKLEHAQTQQYLADAIEKGNGWKASAEKTLEAARAHQDLANACLEREQKTKADFLEREAIMQQVQPRLRTEKEQQEVIDDETRKALTLRFNRPL